jgi:pimeloyl-ACP methyl ester carboxylesterase
VLIDPACYEPRPSALHAVARVPLVGSLLFKQLWGRVAFEAYFRALRQSVPDAAASTRVAAYYEAFNSPAARGCAFATLRSMLDTRNVEARTTQITTPTLVLWGRSDPIYPASHGPRLAREIRGAGLEVLDAGHSPQEECPREVSRIISEFLRAERDAPGVRGPSG